MSIVQPTFEISEEAFLLAQAKELTIRLRASLAVLQVSRHLLGMDRDQVEKALERADVLLDTLRRMAGQGDETEARQIDDLPARTTIPETIKVITKANPYRYYIPSRR